jgi:predicted flap endonuclease-1-like 5' DNA nuclease
MSHINKIEGIGVSHTKKLEAEGIKTAEQLLQAGSSPKHRQELAKKTGFSEHHILKWVNQADLFRVKGIGRQYAELLQSSGVDSVLELAQRTPDHLRAALKANNDKKRQVHLVPGAGTVDRWVDEAKKLPRIVTY